MQNEYHPDKRYMLATGEMAVSRLDRRLWHRPHRTMDVNRGQPRRIRGGRGLKF
jgi:hypothetical protein